MPTLKSSVLWSRSRVRGTFIAAGNQDLLREERVRHVEESLERAIADARPLGLTSGDLHEMLDLLLED